MRVQHLRKVKIVAESVDYIDINSPVRDHRTVLQILQSKERPVIHSSGNQPATLEVSVQIHDIREERMT